ncbi:hypothetical protein P8452_31875 [Trifolium repens]|nr:hypothetical protein P8452_31875 [Trifolium repens]
MSHVPNINATKITELHGDWLVVRSKNRKPSTPKNISNNKNNQYSKGNMFKGNNAGKKTNQFAISKQHMQTSYKVAEPHIDREGDGKNKRQRQDIDMVSGPAQQIKHKGHNKVQTSTRQKHVVYDVGFGAKSTVRMQATSPNRFTILQDEENARGGGEEVINLQKQNVDHVKDNEMVPETQFTSNNAAT